MIGRDSEFADDINWSVYNKQQNPTPPVMEENKDVTKQSAMQWLGNDIMAGVEKFNKGVEENVVAPMTGFAQGIVNAPIAAGNFIKNRIENSNPIIERAKQEGKYNLPDVPSFDVAPHTFQGNAGEALSLALGGRGFADPALSIAEKGVKLAGNEIKKGYTYLHPETAGKQAEEFRAGIGEGTSKENIKNLSRRAQFAKESTKQEALIPKTQLYAQEGKSQVYDINPSELPEGNLDRLSYMIAPGEKFGEQEAKTLSAALRKYRKNENLEDFQNTAEDIFGIPELDARAASRIEDALSMPTERDSLYFKNKRVSDPYYEGSTLDLRHTRYEKNSSLENYDALQSAIKKEMRKIRDRDSRRYHQLELNVKNLDKDKQNFVKTLPENMQSLESDFRAQYKEYASRYEKGKKGIGSSETLRNLAEGKHDLVSDKQIVNLFAHPTSADKKIIRDLGPSAARNALYAALQRVNPNDAKSMANTILDLKRTKGFDDIVTKDMEDWANNMLTYLSKSQKIRNVLDTGAGVAIHGASALAGGMMGGGEGAVIGYLLPYGFKGAKYLAEKLPKLKK